MDQIFKVKAGRLIHRAIIVFVTMMTIFSGSFASLFAGAMTAHADDTAAKIEYDDKSGTRYTDIDAKQIFLFCMNNKMHWPSTGTSYAQVTAGLTADDFDSTADYEVFQSKQDEFWNRLKAILYMGYSHNGLGMYTVSDTQKKLTETEYNDMLKVPDVLRQDFPDILGDATFTLTSYKKETLQKFFDAVYSLCATGKTSSGLTRQEIQSMTFYKAASALVNYGSDAVSAYPALYPDSVYLTASQASSETQAAVWKLMNEYGIKNNDGSVSIDNFGQQLLDQSSTVTVPNAAPAEGDLSIDGDPTFTYRDGKWYSGKLKLTVKDGSSLADYQGTYTLKLPAGVTTTTGETTVKSGEEFQLVSDMRPSTDDSITASAKIVYLKNMNVYRPTADQNTYQSMIGAAFGETTVSAKSAFKVKDEGTLKIVKYAKDADGKADTSQPIKGVEFTITGPNDYSKTAKTDENGKISLSGLTPGEYTVTESSVEGASPEVEAPSADDKTQKVTVTADKTATAKVSFSDELKKEKTGTFTIQKYIKGTTTGVKGVQFKIMGPDSQVDGKTYTTDKDGKITLPAELKSGKYTITELTTPGDGFTGEVELKEQTASITIGKDGQTDQSNDMLVFEDQAATSSSSSSPSSSSSSSSLSSSSSSSSNSSSSSESSSLPISSSSSSSMSSSSSISSSSSSENSSSSISSSSSLPVSSESSSSETSSSSSDSSSTPVTPTESSSASGTEISGVDSSSTTSTSASAVPTTPSAPAASSSSAKKSFIAGLLPQTGQAKSLLWVLLGVVIVAGVAIKLYLDKKKK